MAVSLNDIKTKIASTKNTSQITNAMQMVSAAKLGRSEEAARNFQVYAQKVRKLLTDILHGNGDGSSTNPMLISRPVKKTGYIVITSDRGLVGGYNSSILKAVMELKEEYHPDGKGFEMICIGGMGADFFKARGIQPIYELRGLADQPSFDEVRKIISKTIEMYQNELFDELYVCYNHHVNTLTSQMRVEQMLPIVDLDPNEADEEYSLTFELETSRDEILEQLLPQFAESMIYGAIIDAKTAENAAGMTAMQTATDNAKKVINDLTIQYNRARQAAICLLYTSVPLVYEVASIPEKFIKDFKKEEITSHFFQTLQQHGYRIGKSQQTIYARLAKEKIAHYLEVEKGHAILALTQVSYLEDGTAFEYVKSQYVGERFEFYLENN